LLRISEARSKVGDGLGELDALEDALEICQQNDDQVSELAVEVLLKLGLAHHQAGDLSRSGYDFQMADETLHKFGHSDSLVMARLLMQMGLARADCGDNAAALACYTEALEICKGRDMYSELYINLLSNIGRVRCAVGCLDEALSCYQEARMVRGKLKQGRSFEDATLSCNIGFVMSQLGDQSRAIRELDKGIEIHTELGSLETEEGYLALKYRDECTKLVDLV